MTVSLLTPSQAAEGVALSEEAGWNQNAADWRFMLEAGRTFGLRDTEGRLVATALVLPHGERFAWISMVLVTAVFQRRGIATGLLRHCIADIEARGSVAGLDATAAGREVYRPLGFEDVYGLQRLHAPDGPHQGAPVLLPPGVTIRAMTPPDMAAVAAFDAGRFGGDRRALLDHLLARRPDDAWIALSGGSVEIAGYVLGRDGRECRHIGPLVASDEAVALALADRSLSGAAAPAYIDVPDRHTGFVDMLTARGFTPQRAFARMLIGRTEPFDDPASIFAIAGPELG